MCDEKLVPAQLGNDRDDRVAAKDFAVIRLSTTPRLRVYHFVPRHPW